MVNKLILLGRLGTDPEVKMVGEVKVAQFNIATSEKYKDVEKTEWTTVVCWRGLADVVEKYLKKGDLVYVEGRKETQTWEKDGETKYKVVMQCNVMKMLGGNKNATTSAPTPIEPNNDLPF